jgi:hypothetical protein
LDLAEAGRSERQDCVLGKAADDSVYMDCTLTNACPCLRLCRCCRNLFGALAAR